MCIYLAQQLYITFDIECDIAGDIVFGRHSQTRGEDSDADGAMFKISSHQLGRWLKHTASVPKGFLRYYVLGLLRKKPMSGSEIMEEIEKETGARWKPSPGSVYPLLAWLQDNGYTKELPKEEGGIKRYMLTEKGKDFFEEQTKFGEKLQKKLLFLAPLLFSGFWFTPHSEKLHEIREPVRRFANALLDLRASLKENLTAQAIKEVGELLSSTAEEIEELNKKIKVRN